VVRQITMNDFEVGRNVDEVIRLVKAFQLADQNKGQECPANWVEGKDTIVTNPKDSLKYFEKHSE
jgi:peroxiredoxin 2/4